jgi:hypothetical protein
MTLYVGAKVIKCDDAGVPVKGESYVLFEITELTPSEMVDNEVVHKHVALKKLADPVPAQEASAE